MKLNRLLLVIAVIALVAVIVINNTPDETPVADQVLHRGLTSDPESLDPHKARSTQAGDVLRDLGEGLLTYSPDGELVAGVAESWDVSEDGLRYTFRIRDNARWSNGDALTAEHFVFSL